MPADHALTAVKVLQWSENGEQWNDNEPASIGPDPVSGARLANTQIKLPPCQAGERTVFLRFVDLHGIPSASQPFVFLVPPDPAQQQARDRLLAWDRTPDKQIHINPGRKDIRCSLVPDLRIDRRITVRWSVNAASLDLVGTGGGLNLMAKDPLPTEAYRVFLRIEMGDLHSATYSFPVTPRTVAGSWTVPLTAAPARP